MHASHTPCPTLWPSADLFNEPYQARWNVRGPNDWGTAAAAYGNAVLRTCPRLLIFVQGAGRQNVGPTSDTCWGGSFTDVRNIMHDPVPGLRNKSKLVFSPHAYGPSLYKLPATKRYMPAHFKQPMDRYKYTLPSKWTSVWGYTTDLGIRPPLVISETGGDMVCCNFAELRQPGADAQWQVELVRYLHRKSAGMFYFCLNPYSDDSAQPKIKALLCTLSLPQLTRLRMHCIQPPAPIEISHTDACLSQLAGFFRKISSPQMSKSSSYSACFGPLASRGGTSHRYRHLHHHPCHRISRPLHLSHLLPCHRHRCHR